MILNPCFKVRNLILATALVSGLGLVTHAGAQESSYFVDLNTRTVTSIGTLGGARSRANALNDTGQVVGSSFPAEGDWHAFITGPDGIGMRNLGTLGGPRSYGSGINAAGRVVGDSDPSFASAIHAFITGPDGMGMRDLGTLVTPPGSSTGEASSGADINAAGQIVGSSGADVGGNHAFITGPDGMGMRDLGTFGGYFSSATGINDAAQVVGWSGTSEGNRHAFITGPNGMGMRDLGTLGGHWSSASSINDAGQVVGYFGTEGSRNPFDDVGSFHAFITGPNGEGMRDLGTLGTGESLASGINDAGQVVGWSETAEDVRRAFITGTDGMGMMDLNSLVDLPEGVILTEAIDINNNGQVIATGIPEPETYALMLAGLGLIGFIARRKKSEDRI